MRGHIVRRSEGSYTLFYDLPRGPGEKRRQKCKTVKGTKKHAEAELARILKGLHDGTHVEETRLTVQEYFEQHWLPFAKSQASAKTYERWSEIVRVRLLPAFGALPLARLKPATLQAAYDKWLTSGGRDGSRLSPRTVLHYHRVLFHALKHAVRLELLARNAAASAQPPKTSQPEMKALDEVQAQHLLGRVRGTRLEVPVVVALYSGIRRGELLALRWQDVDFERGRIAVRQTLEETNDGMRFKEPKTVKSRRTIALPPVVMDALRGHRKEQAKQRLALGGGYTQGDLVFPNADGTPWSPDHFGQVFKTAILRVVKENPAFPRIRLHDLRHSSATLLMRAGVPLKVVSERLGHSTTTLTGNTYSHVLEGMDADASERLADLLATAEGGRRLA